MRIGFAIEPILDLVDRLAGLAAGGERALHPIDRPEQIDGRRPRRGHQLADLVELGGELLRARRLLLRATPSAMPIAAATPIAGAPRMTMVLMARATSAAVLQRT